MSHEKNIHSKYVLWRAQTKVIRIFTCLKYIKIRYIKKNNNDLQQSRINQHVWTNVLQYFHRSYLSDVQNICLQVTQASPPNLSVICSRLQNNSDIFLHICLEMEDFSNCYKNSTHNFPTFIENS